MASVIPKSKNSTLAPSLAHGIATRAISTMITKKGLAARCPAKLLASGLSATPFLGDAKLMPSLQM